MVIEACVCPWEIEGVARLPPHSHYSEIKVRRQSDGLEMAMRTYWVEQDGYEVLSEVEGITVWVDWKKVCRP